MTRSATADVTQLALPEATPKCIVNGCSTPRPTTATLMMGSLPVPVCERHERQLTGPGYGWQRADEEGPGL